MKIVTVDQMREIENKAATIGLTVEALMENAGRAIAEETKKAIGGIAGRRILILAGPGNNGGDGLVAARYFDDWGAEVNLYLCGQRTPQDKNLALVQTRKINTVIGDHDENYRELGSRLFSTDIVIDAVFGTGTKRPLQGLYKWVMNSVIEAKKGRPELIVIAVDTPSGLDVDTGSVDESCPQADMTITLGYPKPGLFIFPGADRVGKLVVADIGIPPSLAEDIAIELITQEWVQSVLPKRPRDSNKGTFGRVLVVAGSINYIGAAYLACMGVVRVGAGLVTLATARSLQPILAAKLTETTYLPLPEAEAGIIASEAANVLHKNLVNYDVLAMGCGLGQNQSVVKFVSSVLFGLSDGSLPAVIMDADALNILAQTPQWERKLKRDAVLTPHPGEMARLTGMSVNEVQRNCLGVVTRFASQWGKTVVLKGACTIVAAPDGRAKLCFIGNPGLSSAGTGDVLTGAIAGLVAQGMPLFEAAACGAYLHARAGGKAREKFGDAGMLASDLLPLLPQVIREIKETKPV